MAQRITREDLEGRFRNVQADLQGKVDDKKQSILTVVAVGGVVLLVIFYLLGRRSGKRKTTFVEIRRV
ncbi:MAG: hypothetical protein RI900_102 [Actinomycetota bacterium]|jgi:hypothetical protein